MYRQRMRTRAAEEAEAKLELLREIRVAAELWRAPCAGTAVGAAVLLKLERNRRAEVLRNSDATTPGFFK
jgi:hypothetical protein